MALAIWLIQSQDDGVSRRFDHIRISTRGGVSPRGVRDSLALGYLSFILSGFLELQYLLPSAIRRAKKMWAVIWLRPTAQGVFCLYYRERRNSSWTSSVPAARLTAWRI